MVVGSDSNSWTNPTPTYEVPWIGHPRGRLHLFFNKNNGACEKMSDVGHNGKRTLYTFSDDLGETWASVTDLTVQLQPKGCLHERGCTWDTVGPGNGVQKVRARAYGSLPRALGIGGG